MKHERLELKNYFSFLGEEGRNPTLDIYLPYNMVEMKREKQKNTSWILIVIPIAVFILYNQKTRNSVCCSLFFLNLNEAFRQ